MTIEIDAGSGFCFGVTTAIRKAEEELRRGTPLYSLGDIVHNGEECKRLARLGLIAIDHARFRELRGGRVLLRAHGEPPETYAYARAHHIELIDATCPVVLSIQKRIKQEAEAAGGETATRQTQIVIFGQRGHAEVLGLVGQTGGRAIVVEGADDLHLIDFTRDVSLYSQTTQSLSAFRELVETIRSRMAPGTTFRSTDTICRQVANRLDSIRRFAASHTLVFFVCGSKSSNGRVLLEACREVNPHTHHIEDATGIDATLLTPTITSIGICGATSTPAWLMEHCRDRLLTLTNEHTPPVCDR